MSRLHQRRAPGKRFSTLKLAAHSMIAPARRQRSSRKRNANVVSVLPAPLLGHPETRGLVAIAQAALVPDDIELLLLTRPDVPLTPAAEFFAHCLASVVRASPQGGGGPAGAASV